VVVAFLLHRSQMSLSNDVLQKNVVGEGPCSIT